MVLLPQTAEIRTISKSLPRSFQNNFKYLFFKRLYQIDEILKYFNELALILSFIQDYSTVTDFARLRGLSTSLPLLTAI